MTHKNLDKLEAAQPALFKRKAIKQIKNAREILTDLGINPLEQIARISLKAEKQGELAIAQRGWQIIQEYVAPKYKAVDPAQQVERAAKAANLAELQRIKQAILEGTVLDTDFKELSPEPDFIAEVMSHKD